MITVIWALSSNLHTFQCLTTSLQVPALLHSIVPLANNQYDSEQEEIGFSIKSIPQTIHAMLNKCKDGFNNMKVFENKIVRMFGCQNNHYAHHSSQMDRFDSIREWPLKYIMHAVSLATFQGHSSLQSLPQFLFCSSLVVNSSAQEKVHCLSDFLFSQ